MNGTLNHMYGLWSIITRARGIMFMILNGKLSNIAVPYLG